MKILLLYIFLFIGTIYLIQGNDAIAQRPIGMKIGKEVKWVMTTNGCYRDNPPEDSVFKSILDAIYKNHIEKLPIGERVAAIGKLMIDKPYIEKSLEITNDESITVCNLLGFDCVTFFVSHARRSDSTTGLRCAT